MKTLIETFPEQLTKALKAKPDTLTPPQKLIYNVVISGMGGSAIGASLLFDCTRDIAKLPITVSRDYTIPASVNQHTLLILNSHSGNTEETLSAFQHGLKQEAKIVCITSGGSLGKLATDAGCDVITLPTGMPPRTALAYSFIAQLHTLNYFEIISNGYETGVEQTVNLLTKQAENIQKTAERIAKKCLKKIPCIYIQQGYESVAWRWRQQFNENAKMLATHNTLPEMNHNEIMGWQGKLKYAVILLRTKSENERIQKRFAFLKDTILAANKTIVSVDAKGKSQLEQAIYLIHLGDWVSYYAADLRGVDAMDIGIIENLKKALD